MDTCFSPSRGETPSLANFPPQDDVAQPFIYSFRCTQGMEDSLSRIMQERAINRSSVIRLALYMFDCFCRRGDVGALPMKDFMALIETMEPEEGMGFSDFIRGSGRGG